MHFHKRLVIKYRDHKRFDAHGGVLAIEEQYKKVSMTREIRA